MIEFSKFDRDPEALAWAREKVQKDIDRYRRFELLSSNPTLAKQWRKFANMLRMDFIGGEGCVIAAFDERLPVFAEAWELGKEASK